MLNHSPPRIALIGAGWIVSKVWHPLLADLGCAFIAVVDPHLAQADAAARFGEQVRVCAAITQEDLAGCDLAVICSPNRYHVDHAVQALQLGLDVIIDKPACVTLGAAEHLIAAARAAGRTFWVTAASSARDDVTMARQLIGDRQLGDIRCIDASWRRANGVPRPGSWFTSRELALGGSSVDLGWHLLEVALGLLGHPRVVAGVAHLAEPSAVAAVQGAAWRQDLGASPATVAMDVDTQLYAALQCAGGQLVRLSTAWTTHGSEDRTSLSIHGSEGELQLDTLFGFSQNRSSPDRLVLRRGGIERPIELPAGEKIAPYRRFLQAVLAARGDADRRHAARAEEEIKLLSIVSAYGFI